MDLKKDLVVKVDNDKLQFVSSDRKHLKSLLDQYIKKEIEAGNLATLDLNYPLIKKYFINAVKSGGTVINGFSENVIDEALKIAIYSYLISDNREKTQGSSGLNFIFSDFNEYRSPEQTLKHLQQTWGLDVKSVSLKKNSDYEIPTEFMALIEYHTKFFIEREIVIDRFERFKNSSSQGYFILQGEPGVGKTALLANYAQKHKCPCYFIQRAQGINKFEDFIDSICEQILFKYYDKLGYLEGQLEDNCDINLFNRMLQDLTKDFKITGDKLVIVIDALDEVVQSDSSENILKLPVYVPEGVYFLMSQRPKKVFFASEAPLLVDNIMRLIGEEWKQDFRNYFTNCLKEPSILREWITGQIQDKSNELNDEAQVIDSVVIKSDGNFRFLKNVLNDIERGLFTKIEDVPQGLKSYYQNHLSLMGINSSASPTKLRLLKLLVEKEWIFSSDLKQIAPDARAIIEEWEQFLATEDNLGNLRYRLYHPSFGKFVSDSDIYAEMLKVDI
jgi:Cdc6-like AAA superfamily ATPase